MSAKIARDKEMNVAMERLFRAITDFEAYPQFLSEVVSSHVEPTSTEHRKQVTFELEVVKRFKYQLEFTISEKKDEVHWRLLESNFFKTNEGCWLLKPTPDNKTLVHYELDVSFGFLVPSWVSRKLTEINLPRMLESFEARAMSLGAM